MCLEVKVIEDIFRNICVFEFGFVIGGRGILGKMVSKIDVKTRSLWYPSSPINFVTKIVS